MLEVLDTTRDWSLQGQHAEHKARRARMQCFVRPAMIKLQPVNPPGICQTKRPTQPDFVVPKGVVRSYIIDAEAKWFDYWLTAQQQSTAEPCYPHFERIIYHEPTVPKIEEILKAVAKHFNLSIMDLKSPRRTANIVRPRQIAMYLAKVLTLRSLPEIGRHFGGRDHATVLHAVRKIGALIGKDTFITNNVRLIRAILEDAAQL